MHHAAARGWTAATTEGSWVVGVVAQRQARRRLVIDDPGVHKK
jgi:hypothetical protein